MRQQHLLCREFPIHNNAGVFVEESNKSLLQHVVDDDTITADTFEQDSSNPIRGRGAEIDKLLTEKLNNMSMDERTLGIHELHGVADDIPEDEDPKLLETKLQEMNETIRSFIDDTAAAKNSNVDSKTTTTAYQKAIELDADYVERIKLLCLKADCYDAQRAATRAVSFFSFKLRLFGHAKLVKNITLDDLNQEDMKILNNGVFQLLQQRDRAGRGIIMLVGKLASEERDTESFLRILYYMHMTAIRDKEIQNKGLVLIFYTIGQTKFHRDRPERHGSSLLCLPVRVVAIHVCCDKKLMDFAAKLLCHSFESKLLCRFRCHYGTYFECMYNLMTFGIPKEVIPIKTENGDLDLTAHHLWIKSVQAREEAARANNTISSPTNNEIAVPGNMDIIVGRGILSRSSVGYLRFRDLIQERRDDYDQALRRSEKTSIANDILQKAKAAGCRFVRWTREGPVECDDLAAKEKISHAFRNMRRNNTKDGKGGEQAVKRNLAEPSEDQFTKESKFRHF